MTYVNKRGLCRDIPDAIKRDVRQRCGFGCVRCGSAIYRYHHFDPPFEEAETHVSDGITLLCGACHDLAHGFLSRQTLQACNQNPKCFEQGFSCGPFDVGSSSPVVVLGNLTFIGTPIILEAFGNMLIRLTPNDTTGCMLSVRGASRDLTVSGRPPWECGDGYIEKRIRPSRLAGALDQRRGAFHEARF